MTEPRYRIRVLAISVCMVAAGCGDGDASQDITTTIDPEVSEVQPAERPDSSLAGSGRAPDSTVEASPTSGSTAAAPAIARAQVAETPGPDASSAATPAVAVRPAPPVPSRPPVVPSDGPPATTAAQREAALASWARFQEAVRNRDRDAIQAGFANEVSMSSGRHSPSSEVIRDIIDELVDSADGGTRRRAYLDVSDLNFSQPQRASFETTVEAGQNSGRLIRYMGGLRQVARGDWRLYVLLDGWVSR